MRTAVFIGLLFIAVAIDKTVLDTLSYGSLTFIAVLTVVMILADTVEILRKNK
jgi:hypothetical protein